jgi:rRNA maturation endonuclease Nob1
MGSCLDLRKYEDSESIQDAFSKIVSGGKPGYKTVIEKKKIPPKCIGCGRGGDEGQKFCPQCGGKMVVPLTHCPGCKTRIADNEKFCTNCGHNLAAAIAANAAG